MLNEAHPLLLLLLLATLASVAAHPYASRPSHPSSTSSPRPTAYTIHLHETFDDAAGSSSRREALSLRSAFAAKFGVSAAPINPATCDDTNTVSMPMSLSLRFAYCPDRISLSLVLYLFLCLVFLVCLVYLSYLLSLSLSLSLYIRLRL
jgi:hypothetical protein